MCWKTYEINRSNKNIANEDIPIFKVVGKNMLSVYMDFTYELNKKYITTLEYPKKCTSYGGDVVYSIHEGFHSYSFQYVNVFKYFNFIAVVNRKGRVLDNFVYPSLSVIKCLGVIPKGSVYFLNENGEYVSDEILLTSVEKIEIFKNSAYVLE